MAARDMPTPTPDPPASALMTSATTAPPTPAPPRRGVRVPGWLATLVVVLVAVGAAYAGWRLLRPPPAVDLSQFESNDTGRGPFRGRRGNGPPEAAEGVTQRPDGGGTVRAGTFVVQFLPGTKPTLLARSRAAAVPADAAALQARLKLLGDAATRKTLGVTADQVARLRRITTAVPPAVDPPTRSALLDLWTKAKAAPPDGKPAADKALHDAVTAAAAGHAKAVTAASKIAADQVRAVVPADVLGKAR